MALSPGLIRLRSRARCPGPPPSVIVGQLASFQEGLGGYVLNVPPLRQDRTLIQRVKRSLTRGSPRAFRAWPLAWPSPLGPLGWQRSPGSTARRRRVPRSGTWWTDSGSARQRRELKHRPHGETRPVPIHPDLVALLREHLKKYQPGPDGRIFTGPRGGIFNDRAYLKIFHQARAAAFHGQEAAFLLARRPYDLRHAAVSTWLNAGVPAPQVADWAGHSVDVLLRVYAKCISGQQYEAKRRIEEATRPRDDE